jgi:hypothetical protein
MSYSFFILDLFLDWSGKRVPGAEINSQVKPFHLFTVTKEISFRERSGWNMGWSVASSTDFSGYQIEIAFLFSIFIVMAIWVYYNSERYFDGLTRHVFWLATMLTGPVGLVIYLWFRRRNEY